MRKEVQKWTCKRLTVHEKIRLHVTRGVLLLIRKLTPSWCFRRLVTTRRRAALLLVRPGFVGFAGLMVFAGLLALSGLAACAQDSAWIRPLKSTDAPMWGRRDGVVFWLHAGDTLPRGLIRVGIFKAGESEPRLLNFIAVEPIVAGPGKRFDRLAFSELEMSTLDPGQRGKRMWVDSAEGPEAFRGKLETLHTGKATVERLSVRIDVERFTASGAHVFLLASVDSDHPDQLRLSVFAEKDSPPIEELTVTATMGNYERLRRLWLADGIIDSRQLFAGYTGDAFIEKASYPLGRMLRTDDGGAIVFCTPSESDPGSTPGNSTAHWPYLLPRYTQYWLVPGDDVQPDLRTRVNARRVYWKSQVPVLGGIAFENFEVRERYVAGQTFIFGVSRSAPAALYDGSSPLPPDETPDATPR
jgi:hypothetical protein